MIETILMHILAMFVKYCIVVLNLGKICISFQLIHHKIFNQTI